MVLGGTIAELQKKIGAGEFRVWQAYFHKHGRPMFERMFDRGPAIVGSILSQAHGGKQKMADFMPYPLKPESSEMVPSAAELVTIFGGVNVKDGRK